ncbi:5-oxoprolinase subunit C family protein [Jannaschia ovalis]|uniref:Biotin-dependent carboxyltransferase family protein n=1 Tax=Jannaschia ovalis TaxID=3038773 RepID=A0ABY8LCD7_9RHOB|nr:biotin-dependent carboxyltransferase family protein [Jannaschia sp. GRR-S6-38]WGH78982.1 biotin-dependent carboxyltransferase family protein [Jannaschia sp. GRR-S6-38]
MIELLACGPLVTVQDAGRPGYLSQGLAQGGAADRMALAEAERLLGEAGAGIETPGAPLRLKLDAPMRLALTGAPMRASVAGRALEWNTAQTLPDGAVLDLKPAGRGVYSYLHVQGGLRTEAVLGSRAAHLIAGIGRPLEAGDRLPCEASEGPALRIVPQDRFGGGEIRLLPTPQTRLFPEAERARFAATAFTRDPRGNRQGVRLDMDGGGFATEGQLSLLSDFILPGDIQMTGDGVPYILGPECQTTGGYPRIGTVIGADLPRALQAPPGATLRFRFVTAEEARAAATPPAKPQPLVRDPREVDLYGAQLIGGVVSARAP